MCVSLARRIRGSIRQTHVKSFDVEHREDFELSLHKMRV